MKSISVVLGVLIGAQAALAGVTKKPIQNAEVVVFDAICTPTSPSEGYLTVSLQMSSGDLFVRGSFYSYSEASSAKDPKNWHLISLDDCQKTQADLAHQAGRKIALSGQYFEQAYDTYENVWGKCREHPLVGVGTYPCKRGTREVTKYHRETILNMGSFYILNKND